MDATLRRWYTAIGARVVDVTQQILQLLAELVKCGAWCGDTWPCIAWYNRVLLWQRIKPSVDLSAKPAMGRRQQDAPLHNLCTW